MTHQAPVSCPGTTDPGQQIAQLRELLRLVERVAGHEGCVDRDALLEEAARITDAYDRALPVVQRRFDALAAETAIWSAAGVEALIAAAQAAPVRAAAARLAAQVEHALDELTLIIRA